jgi:predicted Zn-dependent protease
MSKTTGSGFMYGVVHEASKVKNLRRRMNASCFVAPSVGPAKWQPPTTEVCLAAIGDLSKTTRQFRECLNGNSDNFSACPAPWDDEYLAKHGTEAGEMGQTYDDWSALTPEPESATPEFSSPSTTKQVPRHSVKELHREYAALTKKASTPQQLWRRQEIRNAKKERHNKMLCEGKSSISELNAWTCRVCKQPEISAEQMTCTACGAAPVPTTRTPEEQRDHAKEQHAALSHLRKRVPCGNSKSHIYLIPIDRHFPEIVADAMFQCLKAYLYGQQVHLLAPLLSEQEFLYNDEPLDNIILPHVEDPVVVRNRRARIQQQKDARIASGKGALIIPEDKRQISASAVLDALERKLKYNWHGADNAYVVIALTRRDLCDPQGCAQHCDLMQRLDRKLENVREQQRIVGARLRKAMMKGYHNKQQVAKTQAKILEKEKQLIIAEKGFEKIRLKKRAKYIVSKTDAKRRVSVMSFFRYDPALERTSISKNPGRSADLKMIVKRFAKMIVHNTCEMFGMAHCIYFHCRMNGSASCEQQDLSPMHLCPVCLRKLLDACGIHTTPRVIERYFQLQQFTGGIYKASFGPDPSRWFKQRAGTITSSA